MMTEAKIGKIRFLEPQELCGYLKGRLNGTWEPYIDCQVKYAVENREESFLFAGFVLYGKDGGIIEPSFVEAKLSHA